MAVTLQSKDEKNPLVATFDPERGMTLLSLKKGDVEIIDQSTLSEFEARRSGLGPLIGPHFHRRKPELVPPWPDESLFPHLKLLKEKGITDPFSHGIARYAPWIFDVKDGILTGKLTGKDVWNGVALSALEGQGFTMRFQGSVEENHLDLDLSIVSDADSIVGIHYYLRLPENKGVISSKIAPYCLTTEGKRIPIPHDWGFDGVRDLKMNLDKNMDYTFYPYGEPYQGDIFLETSEYRLKVTYWSKNQESGWQLYHPENASFVCIEPVSAQDPRHPNLTVSAIKIRFEVESKLLT